MFGDCNQLKDALKIISKGDLLWGFSPFLAKAKLQYLYVGTSHLKSDGRGWKKINARENARKQFVQRRQKKILQKKKSYCGLHLIYKILPTRLLKITFLVFQKFKIFLGFYRALVVNSVR